MFAYETNYILYKDYVGYMYYVRLLIHPATWNFRTKYLWSWKPSSELFGLGIMELHLVWQFGGSCFRLTIPFTGVVSFTSNTVHYGLDVIDRAFVCQLLT